MSDLGHKRTFAAQNGMSALPRKRTFVGASGLVGSGQEKLRAAAFIRTAKEKAAKTGDLHSLVNQA
jgi:hypothetical protein